MDGATGSGLSLTPALEPSLLPGEGALMPKDGARGATREHTVPVLPSAARVCTAVQSPPHWPWIEDVFVEGTFT